ncbi:hypothetical protein GLU26_00540 [Nanohaloarchaea archaeon]|nr:hypothetical protein [Candidatus Nanohaloarchaea archaeon]
MNVKKYLPPSLALLVSVAEGYLAYNYIISNLTVPEGSVFTLKTLGPSIFGIFLALVSFIGLIPSVKSGIRDQGISNKVYWMIVSLVLLISILLAGIAILSGSAEYTQFQIQSSAR